jgi:DNA-binding transcriptional ArsR family regulator
MTLPSFLKHIRMLERSGLVRTAKHGRIRRCRLDRDRLALLDDWLSTEREQWLERTDRLEAFVLEEIDRDHPAGPDSTPEQQETP